jgi:hypothetical protein
VAEGRLRRGGLNSVDLEGRDELLRRLGSRCVQHRHGRSHQQLRASEDLFVPCLGAVRVQGWRHQEVEPPRIEPRYKGVKRVVVHDPDHSLCSLTVLSHRQLCIQAVWDECAMNPSLWALVHR